MEVLDINNTLLYKCHSYHVSEANEQELICMKSGVNVECLLMRKVHLQRYQYCMNIEQTKHRNRKQTRGT